MKKLLLTSFVLNVLLLLVVATTGFLFAEHKIQLTPKPTPTPTPLAVLKAAPNKSFDFPATASAKLATLTLVVTTVEKTDKIVSGGKSFTTKNHRSFLIVNTVVTNNGKEPVTMTPSDFVKLLDNGREVDPLYKALPSVVAVKSSYDSSMVFLVDETAKSFDLSIGTNVNKTTQLPVSF